ncbi:vanadium-dependent haloperoxidase [Cesiribacter sp. SM1]|uniref:vanadium-dependent haloperoxidase n=1 Tax=Cesiribacter sp. SM1 TaxID=2861196 RepID=UPI001CD39170|nr:vanadium-dependent haloperoxidase [Cesiribacter sp. SM1]
MKKEIKKLLSAALFLFCLAGMVGCKKEAAPEVYNMQAADPALLHSCSQQLTNVIVHDIFKPPVASRIYAYSFLAAYEALQPQSAEHTSLAGKLNGFTAVPAPEEGKVYCYPLASTKAFIEVGKALTFNMEMWEDFEKDFYAQYEGMGIPADVYERSSAYGEQVAKHILAYAGADNYKITRGYRHTLTHKAGSWVPTPPTYAEACEPRWNTIRTFTLDSAAQFGPPPPAAYDLEKGSEFYKLVQEVYQFDKNLTEEQMNIAYFWDDNPFVTTILGHAAFAEKKMTPPGHWIEITRTVAQDQQISMLDAAEAYTLAAIALYDGFIACWDAKYKTDRIRPVTVINSTLDGDWMPFLETPAFPEYVSGHSTISAAAGRVLTHKLGEGIAFTDSTEHKWGHGVRSFSSFEQAYWEASISRVYGGIHFRDGVEEGTYLGERIGEWVWAKTKGAPADVLANKPKPSASTATEPLKASAK